MQVGDWIEHLDSPATRGIVIESGQGDDLRVLVSGDEEARVIWAEDLRQWWEPLHTDDGAAQPPFWVKQEAIFLPRAVGLPNIACVHAVRLGWVAYYDHSSGDTRTGLFKKLSVRQGSYQAPVFMIARWSTFHEQWTPERPPTAWARLLEDEPCPAG